MMALERAFKRLSVRPSPWCQQCRRTFVSSVSKRQQSATAAFASSIQSDRPERTPPPHLTSPPRTTTPPRPADPASAAVPASPGSAAARTKPSSNDLAELRLRELRDRSLEKERQQRMEDMQKSYNRSDLERQAVRRWRTGDVYAPHDLTGTEMAKWKKLRKKPKMRVDVIDQLGINPIDHYKNFSMMSEYMSEMGRIKHSRETSLRPVNQRRMAKAVRRAVGMGLMPAVHRHPEILKIELQRRQNNK